LSHFLQQQQLLLLALIVVAAKLAGAFANGLGQPAGPCSPRLSKGEARPGHPCSRWFATWRTSAWSCDAVIMVLVTTMVTPPLLRLVFPRRAGAEVVVEETIVGPPGAFDHSS